MRVLTKPEIARWSNARNVPLAPATGLFEIRFAVPAESANQARLARALLDWLGPFDAVLLQFTDWPQDRPEEMAIVDALRRGHGDRRRVLEAPGHVFESGEKAEVTGWLTLLLAFGWDAHFHPSPYRGNGLQTTQLGAVRVMAAELERREAARAIAEAFDLEVLSEVDSG